MIQGPELSPSSYPLVWLGPNSNIIEFTSPSRSRVRWNSVDRSYHLVPTVRTPSSPTQELPSPRAIVSAITTARSIHALVLDHRTDTPDHPDIFLYNVDKRLYEKLLGTKDCRIHATFMSFRSYSYLVRVCTEDERYYVSDVSLVCIWSIDPSITVACFQLREGYASFSIRVFRVASQWERFAITSIY